jgi:hypothetical protein
MQRRAAAIYVVFFVVVAIVAFSLTTVAEEPAISVEGQDYSQGDTIRAGGAVWTVNISGGSGELSTVNESASFTAALANNSTLRLVNGTYQPVPNGSGGATTGTGGSPMGGATTPGTVAQTVPTGDSDSTLTSRLVRVVIANETPSGGNTSAGNASGANITTFALREVLDVPELLVADPTVADTTLTAANGTQYVRFQNGSTQPLTEYLPPVSVRNVSVGERFPYQDNVTTVARVNSSAATLAWEGELTRTKELEEGVNVTLGGTTYVTHFPQGNTVTLSENVVGYQAELAEVQEFNERILGLWGVVIISLFAAILVAALAYLPVRG